MQPFGFCEVLAGSAEMAWGNERALQHHLAASEDLPRHIVVLD